MSRLAQPLERPDIYVVARFLERLWRNDRPQRKTELQLAVRLNYNVYKKYLEWLTRAELIAKVDSADGECFTITEKGREAYRTLVEWIKDTIGEEHL